ncbi:lyase family protein [Hyphomicrobium sp. D-2]|uniref:lyase family protein n=1 Tax=Hyphomicrobium sp. D-2 TaxID=3041621 RepID=UPI00245649A6|nr:lyase family protein [Hyphomicrobium sp. D-2]MDH4981003.1 lyase family protein [Hyphomicrobium sp. D-2]
MNYKLFRCGFAAFVTAAFATTAFAEQHVPAPATVQQVFSTTQTHQYVLDIEAAMARAQAAHGAIPQAAADAITAKADVRYAPADEIEQERKLVQHRMVALLNVWRRAIDADARQYVHYGATTVDIYDTALVLQLRRAGMLLLGQLREFELILIDTARAHQGTIMAGRTLGQHALPITFGKKVSTWLGQNRRDIERLKRVLADLDRSAILKGAVGTYAGLGAQAMEIERSFARELGLADPYPDDWHGNRDVFASYALTLALASKLYGAIGQELFLLQMTDIAETSESRASTSVSSSSMAQKVNPSKSEALIHSARTIPRLAEVVLDDVVNFFERDSTVGPDVALREISIQMETTIATAKRLISTLHVNSTAMRENLGRTKGFIMTQRVAFALAPKIGKDEADAHLHDLIHAALEAGIDFRTALLNDPVVAKLLSAEEIDTLLAPEGYVGLAREEVDAVIAHVESMRAKDPMLQDEATGAVRIGR